MRFKGRWQRNRIPPQEVRDRIIFMSMYNDIDWTKDGNLQVCISNSCEVKACAQKISIKDIGHSPDEEQKKHGMERTPTSQKVCGIALQL